MQATPLMIVIIPKEVHPRWVKCVVEHVYEFHEKRLVV
jgi:hypothetical protein